MNCPSDIGSISWNLEVIADTRYIKDKKDAHKNLEHSDQNVSRNLDLANAEDMDSEACYGWNDDGDNMILDATKLTLKLICIYLCHPFLYYE